jgi:hypothetical protein
MQRVSRRHDTLQGWIGDASEGLDGDKVNNQRDSEVSGKSYIRQPSILK